MISVSSWENTHEDLIWFLGLFIATAYADGPTFELSISV